MNIETTNTTLFQGWINPGTAVIVFAIVSVIFIFLYYRQRSVAKNKLWIVALIALRCTSLALLLWVLVGQVNLQETKHESKHKVGVYVDVSQSMAIKDNHSNAMDTFYWDEKSLPDELRQIENISGKLASLVCLIEDESDAKVKKDEKIESLIDKIKVLKDKISKMHFLYSNKTSLELFIDNNLMPYALAALNNAKAKQIYTYKKNKSLLVQKINQLNDLLHSTARSWYKTKVNNDDSNHSRTRLELVNQWIKKNEKKWLDKISENTELKVYTLADSLQRINDKDDIKLSHHKDSNGTNINLVLRDIKEKIKNEEIDTAVLISDGNHSNIKSELTIPEGLEGLPLHVLPIGNEKVERDLWINDLTAPSKSLVNDFVKIEVNALAYGMKDKETEIELQVDGEVIETDQIVIQHDQSLVKHHFKWKANKTGTFKIKVLVKGIEGEKSLRNNEQNHSIQIIDDHVKVFVADNFPRWETRYLINLFDRDDKIKYQKAIFNQLRQSNKTKAFLPKREEEWEKFDIVILGNLQPWQLKKENIEGLMKYIENGGALVLIAGDSSMPASFVNGELQKLLPVKYHPFQDRSQNRAFYLKKGSGIDQFRGISKKSIEQMESVSKEIPVYISPYSSLKDTAVSAFGAYHANKRRQVKRSFLSWQNYGTGNVYYFSSPQSYQLRYRYGDRYHYTFWGEFLRWAAASSLGSGDQSIKLFSDKIKYYPSESVEVLAKIRSSFDLPQLEKVNTIYAFQGGEVVAKAQAVELKKNMKKAVFTQLPVGEVIFSTNEELADGEEANHWKINIQQPTTGEMKYAYSNMNSLKQIVDHGSGVLLSSPMAFEEMVHENVFRMRSKIDKKISTTWDNPLLFMMLIFLLSLEWALRKWLGLL